MSVRSGAAPTGEARKSAGTDNAGVATAARTDDPALPAPRAALGGQSWREIAFLLGNPFTGTPCFLYVVVSVALGAGLAVTVIGLPLLAAALAGCRWLGRVERGRARRLLGVEIEEPSALRAREKGFFAWLWMWLRDPVAWRQSLYFFLRLPWVWLTFALTLVSLIVAWPLLPWLARGLSNADRAMVRTLLSPSDALEQRIAELESDRGAVVDTAAADLRRIERDLHDGAQARLVALAMGLGLAKEKVLEDPEAAAGMVDEAHGEVKLALQELRDLARGIHPAILTDRGLGPALSSLATRCTVPTTVDARIERRPAAAIEGIAYFTVSELLQNIGKHSGATRASIDVRRTRDRLTLRVRDDGRGGAQARTPSGAGSGSGLAGLAERLDAVDGLLTVDSPEGGPTVVTAELPWRER